MVGALLLGEKNQAARGEAYERPVEKSSGGRNVRFVHPSRDGCSSAIATRPKRPGKLVDD